MAIQKFPFTPVRVPSAVTNPVIDLRGLKIMVVDDEPDTRDGLAMVLLAAHADVVLAESAFSALRLLRTARPDIIVSDINMPDGDGYQLMRMVRSRTQEEGGWTPAIALTGHVDPLDQTRALLAGFQVHLAKPIGALDLMITIKSVVANARNRS
jgi:CheY-like chemotaxis protein